MEDEWFDEAQKALTEAGPIGIKVNELLLSSRQRTEDGAVLWAQTGFVCDALKSQLRLLEQLRAAFKESSESHRRLLRDALSRLEKERKALDSALDTLSQQPVDASFGHGTGQSLAAFVSDDGVGELRTRCDQAIQDSSSLMADWAALSRDADDEAASAAKNAALARNAERSALERAHEATNTVAEHAHAMAELLQALTRHYDLTLRALELRDGAQGDADELSELRSVLSNDRRQVPDVLSELRERLDDAKTVSTGVEAFYERARQAHRDASAAATALASFGDARLAAQCTRLEALSTDTSAVMGRLGDLASETTAAASYYGAFCRAYGRLILEIARRHRAHSRLRGLIRDATARFQKAYDEEARERDLFVEQNGPYLPENLWAGLADAPPKIDIVVDELVLPDLSQDTVSRAVDLVDT